MYLILVFLPLISSIICGFTSRLTTKFYALALSISILCINTFNGIFLLSEMFSTGEYVEINTFTWFNVSYLFVSWGFLFDNIALIMITMVSFISALVHLYSAEYMKNDPHIIRFMAYLSFFTFFMLLLVSANNLVQLFVGWEGVGLCSYLLINFWFTRVQANKAALKALIMNRIGDFAFIIGLVLIYNNFKSFTFSIILDPNLITWVATQKITLWSLVFDPLTLLTFAFLVGAVGKSAQLGLHTWLPDAMEGPTPVSALIHAATMVTAGVFLIIRCSPLFVASPQTCVLMSYIGIITAVISGTIGLLQYDIKKIIAYSTCSQLGYMVFGCGLQQFSLSFFHLVNHAFFKALLFLGAGAIIHALSDEQDIRKMGGLHKLLPFTYSIMLIGSLSLMGTPFLTGYYSKDALLEVSYGAQSELGQYLHYLGVLGAGLTAFYSTRLIYYVFLTKPNGFRSIYNKVHEPGLPITITLIVLAFGSIFFGYLFRDAFIGEGVDFFDNSIGVGKINNNYNIPFNVPIFHKFLPLFTSLSFAVLSMYLNCYLNSFLTKLQVFTIIFRNIYIYFNKKWFFDFLYNYFGFKILNSGYSISYKFFDKGLLEIVGPLGLVNLIAIAGSYISKVQNGLISNLLQGFFVGSFLYLGVICLAVL